MSSQNNASAAVEKLRAALDHLRSLAYPVDAYIYGASVVIIHAPYDPDAWAPKPGREVLPEEIRTAYIICHEGIHMAQAATCPYVLSVAENYARLVNFIRRNTRDGKPEALWLPEALRRLESQKTALQTGPADGLSPQHIIEAQAVLEGFRGAFSRHTQDGLVVAIQIAHNLEGWYSELIGRCLEAYGFEFTFHVLPSLCWLALQEDSPGLAFVTHLEKLEHYGPAKAIGWDADQLCSHLRIDAAWLATSLPKRRPEYAASPLSPIMEPYWRRLDAVNDRESVLQAGMHPGKEPAGIRLQDLLPPVTIFDGNVVHMNGPHKSRGWDAAAPLIGAAGIHLETLAWLEQRQRGEPGELPGTESWFL